MHSPRIGAEAGWLPDLDIALFGWVLIRRMLTLYSAIRRR
jgi:hypothetical protein